MINQINTDSKGSYIRDLFSQIAPQYDLINNIITLGFIQKWRKKMVEIANPSQTKFILDLCSGTGKVAELLVRELPSKGKVIGVDFCPDMIKAACQLEKKYPQQIEFKLGDAMNLGFPDNYFNCVTIAFGLRNVEDIPRVLREMRRVVKPGGKVLSLDLAKPRNRLFSSIYYIYFNHLVPLLGKGIHGNREPYSYLPASLKTFLDQEELKAEFINTGLKEVNYIELTRGIVAIHYGIK